MNESLAGIVVLIPAAVVAQPVFQTIPSPPAGGVGAPPPALVRALSPDGRAVAGIAPLWDPFYWQYLYIPFAWSEELGVVPGPTWGIAEVRSVSDHGVVFFDYWDYFLTVGQLGIWSAHGHPAPAPPEMPVVSSWHTAVQISGDSSCLLGRSEGPNPHVSFRWRDGEGWIALPGEFLATGMDAGGQSICGEMTSGSFIWRESSGYTPVGTLPGYTQPSVIRGMSADGSTAVGDVQGPAGTLRPVRWTALGGLEALPMPTGESASARYASASGDVIVGAASNPPSLFVWMPTHGTRDLKSMLLDLGATEVEGWTFSAAAGISADGCVILGRGISPEGLAKGFLARIPAFCYANCDGSAGVPALNVADFSCFLQRFAAGDGYANCDRSTAAPALNIADFSCFLQRFAAGCP